MTRVLLVGATAQIAPPLLAALLASPFVTSLVLLSRSSIRSAPTLAHPKLTQLLHKDFSSLPEELFISLRDTHRITAVIWLVGGLPSRFANAEAAAEANVGLPLQFLEGCVEHGLVGTPAGRGDAAVEEAVIAGKKQRYLDPETQRKPFRFTYLSTYNAVQDPFSTLWTTDAKFRRLKGAGEKALLALADEKGQGMCEVYCLRIGRVLAGGRTVGNVVWMQMGGYISDDLLAGKVLSLSLGGRGDERYGEITGGGVLENDEVMGDDWADINSVTVNG